jgi:hypothetical protein
MPSRQHLIEADARLCLQTREVQASVLGSALWLQQLVRTLRVLAVRVRRIRDACRLVRCRSQRQRERDNSVEDGR